MVIGGVAIVAALAVAGWYGYQKWHVSTAKDSGTTVAINAGFTVDPKTQPDLNRKLVFPAAFPADAKKILTDHVALLVAKLKKDPSDYSSWLDLAIGYKTVGAYEGARQVWEYLNGAAPTQSISFQDLGDLYDLYLKDYPKSESNFLTAIKNGPNQTNPYLGLYELYRYAYKQDTSAAADTLIRGIKAIPAPQNIDLETTLAGYYRDKGDTANAKKYYIQARTEAAAAHDSAAVAQLTAEINALK
jgi:tetratricopeptide (TPR) repeat protein